MKSRSKKLCAFSFGLALGLTCALAMLLWTLWVAYYGVPPMMAERIPEMTGSMIAMGALKAFVKGFVFGFILAAFYNLFSCLCCAWCCRRKEGDCGCNCGSSCKSACGPSKGDTAETK
jgi:hypothetical protein